MRQSLFQARNHKFPLKFHGGAIAWETPACNSQFHAFALVGPIGCSQNWSPIRIKLRL
jgi:hypothetical protein